MGWTPHPEETNRTVRAMRAAGENYKAIQDALGLKSRSAVAGMVSRHCKDIPRKRPAPKDPKPSVKPTRAPSVPRAVTKPVAVPPPPPAPPLLVLVSSRPDRMPVQPGANPVHFVKAVGCRWPLWAVDAAFEEKRVCNDATREGQSFCVEHSRLAYQPRLVRRVA